MQETVDSLKREIEKLKEDNERLRNTVGLYQPVGPVALYYELNRLINGTVDYMRNINIKGLINPGENDDAKRFDRTMTLIKHAKEHALEMEDLRSKFGITGNEDADKKKNLPFIERYAIKREDR